MEPIEYLKIVQQRWRLIVGCTLLAMLVGYLLAPSGQSSAAAPTSVYKAEVALITNTDPSSQQFPLGLAAYLANRSDVAKKAAKELGYTGDPMDLAGSITASPQGDIGVLTIAATNSDKNQALGYATAFAKGLQDFLKQRATDGIDESMAATKAEIATLTKSMNELRGAAKGNPDSQASVDLAAVQAQYSVAAQRLAEQTAQLNQPSPLAVLGDPTVTMVSTSGGISAPSSRTGRMLLVGFVGFVLGVLAALVLERLDTRLRTAAAIGAAFGMPVIAEIPKASRHLRHHEVAVITDPAGGLAESYRALRSGLLLMSAPRTRNEDGTAVVGRRGAPQVLLVTSPRAGDGKSSTVANLAAALAEAGRSVLVLDCDFRNPEAHRYLDVQAGIGLSDLLAAGSAADLTAAIRPTAIPHVKVITAGTASSHPASLLLRIGTVIEKARAHADLILLDSAPMLTINDTTDLVQHADAVLVVCRSGRINNEQAARVTQLLSRASTPVVGIALIGTSPSSAGRSGHRPGGSSTLRSQPYRQFAAQSRPTVVNRTRVRMGRWVRQIGRGDPLDALDPYGAGAAASPNGSQQPAARSQQPPPPSAQPGPRRRVGEAPRPQRPAGANDARGGWRAAPLPALPPSRANGNASHDAQAPAPASGPAPRHGNTKGTGSNGPASERREPGHEPERNRDSRADGSANPAPRVVPTNRPRGPVTPNTRGPGGRA